MLERFLFKCRKVTVRYTIVLKKPATLFYPIRSKTEVNRDSFVRVFPPLPSATCSGREEVPLQELHGYVWSQWVWLFIRLRHKLNIDFGHCGQK